jgi:hypothetical protein
MRGAGACLLLRHRGRRSARLLCLLNVCHAAHCCALFYPCMLSCSAVQCKGAQGPGFQPEMWARVFRCENDSNDGLTAAVVGHDRSCFFVPNQHRARPTPAAPECVRGAPHGRGAAQPAGHAGRMAANAPAWEVQAQAMVDLRAGWVCAWASASTRPRATAHFLLHLDL